VEVITNEIMLKLDVWIVTCFNIYAEDKYWYWYVKFIMFVIKINLIMLGKLMSKLL
jgi:hypothetical protein